MKYSSSLEEFRAEYNILISIGLHFTKDDKVDLAKGSPIKGEMILPKSYFEVDLRLPLPPFKDVVIFLQLALNQLCINTVRLIMSLVVLNHMRGLAISIKEVLCIYTPKRSRISHEWYMSPWSSMSGFITRAPSRNKDLDCSLVVVLDKWECSFSKPKILLRVPRTHDSVGGFRYDLTLHCIFLGLSLFLPLI